MIIDDNANHGNENYQGKYFHIDSIARLAGFKCCFYAVHPYRPLELVLLV